MGVVFFWRGGGKMVCRRLLCVLLLCVSGADLSAQVRTVAGTGQRGPFATGGEALKTAVNEPFGLSMREPGV
ncbi:MAG: hypothetical protein ACKPJD_02645, partial [Planctomycetaceae bacterium]